ncbi:hypothetical protein AURDEDRAFT_159326 [Auricularia subglabra TFB-10046 SS5]|nr:hypothetical protein AURDEDRAFT_159326 [Auricularia subglabra TFB-10046 SS5]
MDTFRTVSWCKILQNSDFGAEIVPDLARVAKSVMPSPEAETTVPPASQAPAGPERPLTPMSVQQPFFAEPLAPQGHDAFPHSPDGEARCVESSPVLLAP